MYSLTPSRNSTLFLILLITTNLAFAQHVELLDNLKSDVAVHVLIAFVVSLVIYIHCIDVSDYTFRAEWWMQLLITITVTLSTSVYIWLVGSEPIKQTFWERVFDENPPNWLLNREWIAETISMFESHLIVISLYLVWRTIKNWFDRDSARPAIYFTGRPSSSLDQSFDVCDLPLENLNLNGDSCRDCPCRTQSKSSRT
jgi:hypothetical protein